MLVTTKVASIPLTKPDPDLEIRGGLSFIPLDKLERSPKIIFSALRTSVSSKNKGNGI